MPAPGAADLSIELLNAISLNTSVVYPSCLLSEDGERDLECALISMKRDYRKSRAVLKKWISSEGPMPPLQLFVKLNEEAFLFITTYFFRAPQRVEHLYDAFEEVYSKEGSTERPKAALELGSIVAQVINTIMNPDEQIQTFFKDVMNKIVRLAVRLVDEDAMHGDYLSDILDNYIFSECLTEFVLCNLKQLLEITSPTLELNSVFEIHSKKWSLRALNVGTVACLRKVVNCLSSELVVAELKAYGNSSPIRWKYLLAVMSVLITEKGDSTALVKGLIEEWLRTGFEENDKEKMYLALIAARHCCAEKIQQFPTYIAWFGSAQPTNPVHFVLFFKFLADIVPYELPLYLKVHVNKVPPAPAGCQNVLTDYIALAKTRLSDLNETTDYLSVFNKCHDTEEESLAADVLQLMNHFLATGEIAKPVIEASVFRKQYYERVFLKCLLSVPERTDPTRGQVIRKLNSLGKIPGTMFVSWVML